MDCPIDPGSGGPGDIPDDAAAQVDLTRVGEGGVGVADQPVVVPREAVCGGGADGHCAGRIRVPGGAGTRAVAREDAVVRAATTGVEGDRASGAAVAVQRVAAAYGGRRRRSGGCCQEHGGEGGQDGSQGYEDGRASHGSSQWGRGGVALRCTHGGGNRPRVDRPPRENRPHRSGNVTFYFDAAYWARFNLKL